jgi:hypothetical protein
LAARTGEAWRRLAQLAQFAAQAVVELIDNELVTKKKRNKK